MRELVRNAIFTDPESGERSVLLAGAVVEDEVAATLDPAAFGDTGGPTPSGPVEVRIVDETPLLEALRVYAEGRGLVLSPDAHGFAILGALIDLDEADGAEGPPQRDEHDDEAEPLTEEQLAEVLKGTNDEVNSYLEEHPEHRAQVLEAEASTAKPRVGIVEGPHATAGQQE